MSSEAFDSACNEVTSDDTASTTVDDYNVEHFVTCVEFYSTSIYLTHQCRVSTEEELLTSLTLSVESTAYLSTTE